MNRILTWFVIALIFALSGPLQAATMASARGFEKSLYGRSAPWADKYAYCGGDPINSSDPSGLEPPATEMDRRQGNTWPDEYRRAAYQAWLDYHNQPGHQGLQENSVEMFFLGPALGKGVGLTVRLAEQSASSITLGAGLPGSDKIMSQAKKNSSTLTEDGFYNWFMHGADDGSLWIKTAERNIPVSPSQLVKIVQRGLQEAGLPLDTPLQLNACFGGKAVPALERLGMKARSWTAKIDVHANGHVTPHTGSLPYPSP